MKTRWWQKMCGLVIALALGLIVLPAAEGRPAEFVLSFNELQPGEEVVAFYAGGLGSLGTGPGPDYGVTFTDLVVSPPDVYSWNPTGNSASGSGVMELDPAYAGLFSFYYQGSGQVCVYSGPNRTGDLLVCKQFPDYGGWMPDGVSSSLEFRSVEFSGFYRFDPLAFGAQVVPEPTALGVMGLAFLALRRRRR